MSSTNNMPSAKTVLSTAASVAASAMLVRTIFQDFLPHEVHDFISSGFRRFINHFSSQLTIIIEEFDELTNNKVYEAAEIYLANRISPKTQTLRISKSDKEKNLKVAMGRNEEIVDTFDGIRFKWRLVCTQIESKGYHHNPRDLNSTFRSEIRSFELCFHKKYKEKVLQSYLNYILEQSKSMKEENKTVKLFTVNMGGVYGRNLGDAWSSINLDHPATFDTLAMDLELKRMLIEDLEMFVQRKDFYRRVGKAWKRGYLLYGPPGTGKSSLIAAMANYLNFDIYDLELGDLRNNSNLRRLLLATANRSILVVEDIDCTVDFQDRLAEARAAQPLNFDQPNQVTLSGLLNFIDGLWSSCGDERIIVFTTNHKDRLDHALLRPGRMDMHVHMSFCTPSGFTILASNYLQINDHPLFRVIEELIKKVEVTPAMVAEELMKKGNPDVALKGLLEFLESKKKESEEANITTETKKEP
ncbi:AAA-ATPase At3g50940-like [Telopea speciosissima]|uniref:AAA-ATPase At3g50940-like n=1 Tax=Telopea speciosissima TaxID=54955 RepID=UPI001CC4AC74|nr:AAA-ATPase At3g50940-like [Telopea speciosissima]